MQSISITKAWLKDFFILLCAFDFLAKQLSLGCIYW